MARIPGGWVISRVSNRESVSSRRRTLTWVPLKNVTTVSEMPSTSWASDEAITIAMPASARERRCP